ncbi:hypothetical protein [Microvirga puerhi]|uniref:Uncharacterized protein n=1 Tax=Microvirga puerhi TaxID=2876078 RepID=A0ABS7VTG7_9HYPH|nr:hypothetical protein [Microvirga puerhi]MBZ6078854.1 hypothetical protein [Microvirga puerhi]
MASAQEFFTPEAVGQLSGAIAAVTAISVTVRRVTTINSPLIPFLVSVILCYVTAGISETYTPLLLAEFPAKEFFQSVLSWLLPAFNACLLFTATIGATEVGNALAPSNIKQENNRIASASAENARAGRDVAVKEVTPRDLELGTSKNKLGEQEQHRRKDYEEYRSKTNYKYERGNWAPREEAFPSHTDTRIFQSWFDRV